MKNNIYFRPKARIDLQNIFRYSANEFGKTRANQYIRELDKTFNNLKENPSFGKNCNDIKPGLRAFFSGSHIIFYRKSKQSIHIIRVLHKSMDYQAYL